MRRWIVIAAVLGAFLAAGGFYWLYYLGPEVPVVAVEARTIREFVEEQAKTRLPHEYLITMPYEGRVEPLPLVEGERVAQGQTVARIAEPDLQLALRDAELRVARLEARLAESSDVGVEQTLLTQANTFVTSVQEIVQAATARVTAGRARYEYALSNLQRTQQLATRGAQTEDELERAQVAEVEARVGYEQDRLVSSAAETIEVVANLLPPLVRQLIERRQLSAEVVQKELAEARAALELARTNFQRGTMESPVDGVVLQRPVTNERLVTAGTVLLKIGQLSELEIEAELLTQDAARIRVGSPVEIFDGALGSRVVPGEVARIYPQGFTKISSLGVEQQRVLVVIRFAPEELATLLESEQLGVDYRVRVRIIVAQKSSALVVPRSALVPAFDGTWQLFVVRARQLEAQPVEIGLMNDQQAEITSGIAAGEYVVPLPETSLTSGTYVTPRPR